MKLEELLAPCPKCGSKDKIAHRKMLDNHRAHAEMETVKCEDCGYIFFVNENMDPDEKKKLLNELNKVKLLIIDELGYLPFSPSASHLLFQLINRRYESKSTIITSNRSPGEWGLIFGDPTAATAILDRLLHHCIPITIMGDSYRVKAGKKALLK